MDNDNGKTIKLTYELSNTLHFSDSDSGYHILFSEAEIHLWERMKIYINNLLKNIYIALYLSEDYIPNPISGSSIPAHIR